MERENLKNYMGYQWIDIEDELVTVGINEEGLEDFETILSVDLPKEAENVDADEVCGALETDEGPLDIYSPVTGTVVEINSAVLDNPKVVLEDPYGDGWLLKVEPDGDDDEDGDEDDEDGDEE